MKELARATCVLVALTLGVACGGRASSGAGGPQPQELAGGGQGSSDDSVASAPVFLGHCRARVGLPTFPLDPAVRESLEGTNGTFVEACDDDGNLTTYQCEMQAICLGMDCAPYPTGEVSPVTFICGSGCEAGACLDAP